MTEVDGYATRGKGEESALHRGDVVVAPTEIGQQSDDLHTVMIPRGRGEINSGLGPGRRGEA